MEPLPKERSDENAAALARATSASLNGAAPEGAERPASSAGHPVLGWIASMEPLPKERSDVVDDPGRLRAADVASMEPLPKERSDTAAGSRACLSRRSLNGAAPEGAERRGPTITNRLTIWRPQWSRSRRSGATLVRAAARAARQDCLNGAAPEGAERRRARAVAGADGEAASMEPLPKERSDAAERLDVMPVRRASMEPLPKERSDNCAPSTASA